MTRLCVGYAGAPSLAICAQIFGVPDGWPWTFPGGHRNGEANPVQTPGHRVAAMADT
jgi:hypothetical protein